MKTFKVKQYEIHEVTYTVEADTSSEAVELVKSGLGCESTEPETEFYGLLPDVKVAEVGETGEEVPIL